MSDTESVIASTCNILVLPRTADVFEVALGTHSLSLLQEDHV